VLDPPHRAASTGPRSASAVAGDPAAARAAARALADTHLAPRAAEVDESERFPHDLLERFAAAGLLGLVVPERFGGAGGDLRHVVAVAEELARVDVSAAVTFNAHASCAALVDHLATEEQRRQLLPGVAAGALLAIAISEPGTGSDAASVTVTAGRVRGGYRIDGVKHYCTNADVADTILVFARTDEAAGAAGIAIFAVGRRERGVVLRRSEKKTGLHGTTTWEIEFSGCTVPDEARLGDAGGFGAGMRALQRGRVGIAAVAVGVADAALQSAVGYLAAQRGEEAEPDPRLADLAMAVTAARWLVYDAADAYVRGYASFGLLSAQAKCFATDVAMRVTGDALQLVGPAGIVRGTYVERAVRDTKILQIFEGTNEIMRVLVARELLGRW
jgi:alkylation response protein AidB-like acyl-CoA dehydrogenase